LAEIALARRLANFQSLFPSKMPDHLFCNTFLGLPRGKWNFLNTAGAAVLYHYIFVRLFSLSFMSEKKTYIQEVMVGDPIDQMIEIVPY
jgi:hypothetical protein